jgi:hypothetical protein
MKRSVMSFVCVFAVMCLGTIVLAQQVSVDFDRSADFSKFRTFAWAKGTPVADAFNHKRIVNAIEQQLTGKGLANVTMQTPPDLIVAYHASFDRDLQITGWGSGDYGPFYGAGRSMSARAQQVVVGTLVIDLSDAATSAMVWRGMAASDLNPAASAERRDKSVNKAVAKLFKNYPPPLGARSH